LETHRWFDCARSFHPIAREEALFAGTSSGANVVAAIQVAARLGSSAKVVTLMADSGLKYLSTDVYRSR
jgi:cysteine synthase A